MVSFKLHFQNNLSINFRKKACFIFLRGFKNKLLYTHNIDYDHEDALKIEELEYYDIPIDKKKEEHKHLASYIYNKYRKYLLNPSLKDIINSKSVRIRASTSSHKAHLIISWFRFFSEYTYTVDNFYRLKDCKHQDLAFINAKSATEGANHSPLRNMTLEAIDQFIEDTPRKEKHTLATDPCYIGVANYFSFGESGKTEGGVINKIPYNEKGKILGYKRLEKIYEEHCGIVAKPIRKTIPKGGTKRPHGLPPGRPYKWEAIVFGVA